VSRGARPIRRDIRKRRQRRLAIHRRDPAEETKRFRLGREATRVEHGVERAVLTQELRPALLTDPTRSGDSVRRIATKSDEVRHLSRIDAVALPHLARADAGRTTLGRLENGHALGNELKRVPVRGRDERFATGFTNAAPPDEANHLVNEVGQALRRRGLKVEQGEFGAHMQVSLVNDGPFTIWLETN